jgi:hypothetical protein
MAFADTITVTTAGAADWGIGGGQGGVLGSGVLILEIGSDEAGIEVLVCMVGMELLLPKEAGRAPSGLIPTPVAACGESGGSFPAHVVVVRIASVPAANNMSRMIRPSTDLFPGSLSPNRHNESRGDFPGPGIC